MTPAAAPDVHPTPGTAPAPGQGGSLRFWIHVGVLALIYLTVVIAWGHRNAWPDDLLVCLLSVPISVLVARQLFRTEQFGTGTDVATGHHEQLIAALVLAVGIASGQLLLMSAGLACLAIGWLRPSKPGVDWAEWLKIPLLFLSSLPFWLDFDGSRAAFATILENPLANPTYRLPLAIGTSQAHVLGYCGTVGLILTLHGRVFWLALPLLPLFIAGVTLLPYACPVWHTMSPAIRLWFPWLLGLAVLAPISRIARRFDTTHRPIASGHTLRRWFAERRHPPWIAVLVVAVVQAIPLRSFAPIPIDTPSLVGTLILIALLTLLRTRTPRGPIHSRSTAMVAGALALTLVGEFTGSDPACRTALGLVLIGLLSWHCFWPLRVFAATIVATLASLGIPAESPIPAILPSPTLLLIRLGITAASLGTLAWFITRPLPAPGPAGYNESGWVPPKRFALILLGLMLLFQLASAFWPEHEMRLPTTALISSPADLPGSDDPAPDRTDARTSLGETPAGTSQTRIHPEDESRTVEGIDLSITHPRRIPYLLESPDRTLQRLGWKVQRATPVRHPAGEAAGTVATHGSRRISLLWWFEQDASAFANHRYARRILWSSWYLANRDLRLVTLQSPIHESPARLAEFAERNRWFPPRSTPGSSPQGTAPVTVTP